MSGYHAMQCRGMNVNVSPCVGGIQNNDMLNDDRVYFPRKSTVRKTSEGEDNEQGRTVVNSW